jgi:integrase
MARKRKHGVDLPEHVHRVVSKGKVYFFYQAHRGTPRQGQRVSLPRDSATVEFWDAVRAIVGRVAGYSGTVTAMIDAYLGSVDFTGDALAKSTKRIYTGSLAHVKMAIGQHKPDEIRSSHVLLLRDQFAETPGAANSVVSALSTVYKWGTKRDYAKFNPCSGLGKLKLGEHQPWPADIIKLVLENARWEVRRFVLLTLATAQREGDVCSMTLRHVKDGEVRVIQQKTGKELWIPLPAAINDIVEECRASGTIALIPRRNGEPFTANQFRAMWGRELDKEWAKPICESKVRIVPHGLCKNAHIDLYEAGNTDKQVQAVTGRSPAMLAHYSKGTNQRKLAHEAVNRRDKVDPSRP